MALPRVSLEQQITQAINRGRIIAPRGPRQFGKTTLAGTFLPPDAPGYFDLEDPVSRERLQEPMIALANLEREHLAVVYPGAKDFTLGQSASALPLRTLALSRPGFWPG